jgi:SAM-dependent methyltransferase
MPETTRTSERLRRHYEVERELAGRLRRAPLAERKRLYAEVYDELFRRVPDHPQLTGRQDEASRKDDVQEQLRVLGRHLRPGSTFLEVGAGDCALSFEVARRVGRVYAVDVSEEITRELSPPANFELILSDGSSIPVEPGSVDLAYSNQLIEHLHPDDAAAQLRNIHRALAPGGEYLCVTPNRWYGPSDISMHFDDEATGFHLKEYTNAELARLCREVGFSRARSVVWLKWFGVTVPWWVPAGLEALLARLPRRLAKRLARGQLSRVLGITMVARK